ncbi:MAG: ATP-binding protein, partial [Desulfovibrionaceae bacterium]|nr:ATP-binding protein [Desulfovibrionaceae bacterium]
EGIGLRHGNVAENGAVHAFSLGPAGLQASVIGGGEPRSVCATGYLSLIRILLQQGLLGVEGAFRREVHTPLAGLLAERVRDAIGGPRFRLTENMDLDAHDVEAILAVKAAFSLTLERLLAHADISSARLCRVFVAGALGRHVKTDDLEALGFFPSGLGARLTPIGNSSLAGAELFLREPAWREKILHWARSCSTPNLTEEQDFHAGYMRHMRFAW